MFGSGKKKNAAKKAYEIAYALFRISGKISELGIKERLESQAMDLLVSVNAEEYGNAAKAVSAIDALVKFATDLNIISIPNSDVLLREATSMNEIIVECLDKSDDVDVSKFFSTSSQGKQRGGSDSVVDSVIPAPSVVSSSPVIPGPSVIPSSARNLIIDSANEILRKSQDDKAVAGSAAFVPPKSFGEPIRHEEKAESGNPANALRSGNRQIAILDRIRQSGNCKLKELQEVLPDCSERTIRYDLEDLIERNLVERMGTGGPAVSYRIRQIV